MRKITTLIAVAAAAAATPAFAQDDESAFSGPYVGAYAGYDSVAIKDIAAGDSESKGGVAFGGIVGYNVDLDSTVFGIEAEIGDASTNEAAKDILVAGDELKLSANLDLFFGARIGLKASPKTLVYLKAGYAVTKATLSYDDGVDSFAESANLDGIRVGAGVEFAVSNSISVRGEYRYSDYGEYKYQGTPTGLGAKRHQVILGVVGRF